MKAFIVLFIASTLMIDSILLSIYVTPIWIVMFVPSIYIAMRGFRLIKRESGKPIVGFELGTGLDIENPDQPKKVAVTLEDRAINLGFLFIGGPGSGKTVAGIGLLEYFTKKRTSGWAYFEGKGDLDIYQYAMSCGATPDKFFSSELPYSDSINAMAGETESVIERLTRVLIISESEYYRNAQRAALRAIVPLLKALNKPTNMRDLYITLSNEEAAGYVLNLAKNQNVAADTIEFANKFLSQDEDKRDNDINGLLTRLSLFVSGSAAERLNAYQPTLDLYSAIADQQRIYFHLPYTEFAKDIGILLTEQLGDIAKQRQLFDSNRQAFPLIFDDWGSFFYGNFGPITARCRSAKMPVNFLFQSKGQTDRVESGNHFTTEITDNIGGMAILRVNGQETARWAAEQFGQYETNELSKNDNDKFSSESISSRDRPRVRGDELKDLDSGEAIISCLVSGDNGASSNKRFKARFPLPDFSRARDFEWPVLSESPENTDESGLHLWGIFMNRDRLADLKKQIVETALSDRPNETHSIDEINYL